MKDLHHTAKVYPTLLEPQFLLYLAPLFERILISTTLLETSCTRKPYNIFPP